REARNAVRQHFVVLSDIELKQEPGTQPLRKKLLDEALAYFQSFLQRSPEDPAILAEVADAHLRVATITSRIGSRQIALHEFRRAGDLLQQLVQAHPTVPESQRDLALAYARTAVLESQTAQPAEALRSFERARVLQEKLAAANPAVWTYQHNLALTF